MYEKPFNCPVTEIPDTNDNSNTVQCYLLDQNHFLCCNIIT